MTHYLPEFAPSGKQDITVHQLLTHTSGLVAWLPLYRTGTTVAERIAQVMNTTPSSTPGTRYLYSDLNLIVVSLIAEKVTGKPIDVLIQDGITAPLGMSDTGFNPAPALLPRIAATEFQAVPARGMVRGEVHDENAWSFGGVAGHAGMFSTVDDLAVLAQALINGGVYEGTRIMSEESVDSLVTNENTGFPGNAHGLGFELDQRWYMDALSSPITAGHTGFTGTSFVIDPLSRSFVILLSNRVHPSRNWGSVNPARRAVAHELSYAMAVEPSAGDTAWTGHDTGSTVSTLELPVTLRGTSSVMFDLFVDTESTDPLVLEFSGDGGATWQPVPFTVRQGGAQTRAESGAISGYHGRQWAMARATLPDVTGEAIVRWRYTTDTLNEGRGVYVDDVKVRTRGLATFDGERHPDHFVANGWALTDH